MVALDRGDPLFKNGEAGFNHGKAMRELSQRLIALARWAGSGRGASRRSGRTGGLTRWRAATRVRSGSDLARRRLCCIGIAQQRRQIVLPQRQVAAGEAPSVGHPDQYRLPQRAGNQIGAARHRFDEAIAPNHCIVAAGVRPREEMARA
jgi:hypothetical protein